MKEYSNARNLAKRILLLVIISMLFLTATKSQAEQQSTISIQTDQAQYTIGETVYVQVSVPDIQDYKLYYEYQGFEQRYMGDYTSFSFVPRGIGTHYLVLRTRANKEAERHSFEVIEAEMPETPIKEPE
ncbi:hypothetical protein KY348_07540, partial [Candidatus Woesearchaeota archaeon]|nr:hypothetical protein [Candidatus Woesearchaeota archaeon]